MSFSTFSIIAIAIVNATTDAIAFHRMPAAPRLSHERRGMAVAYAEQGLSHRQIAAKLGVSHPAITKLLKKYRETGTVQDRPGRGRRRKTTEREDRVIVRLCLQNRRISVPALSQAATKATGKRLSATLVRGRLLEKGLRSCRAVKKPLLSKTNRVRRLAWAKAHQHWTVAQWSRVLFTDESRFSLVSDRPVLVRRRKGERNNPELQENTMKHGGGASWYGAVLPGRRGRAAPL